jgi:protein subunit release factor A
MRLSHPVVNGKNIGYDDKSTDFEDRHMADDVWTPRVKNLLKAELKRRGVSYRELAQKLTDMGIPESERNIANKIARGGFTAAFFVQCLVAVGATSIRLDD